MPHGSMPHLCLLRLICTQELLRLGRQPRQLLADRHQVLDCCCCLINKAELGGALGHLAGGLASIGVDQQCRQALVVVCDRQHAHRGCGGWRFLIVIYACVWACCCSVGRAVFCLQSMVHNLPTFRRSNQLRRFCLGFSVPDHPLPSLDNPHPLDL